MENVGHMRAGSERLQQFPPSTRLQFDNKLIEPAWNRMPCRLDRIELGRIRGQFLQMEPRVSIADCIQALAMVYRGAAPDHDDVTAKMFEQIPE